MTETMHSDNQARPSDLVRDEFPAPSGEPQPAAPGSGAVAEDDVLEAMKDVVDPELGINVVDLGLIYGVHIEDDQSITIDMTLTTPACPLTDVLEDQTAAALEGLVTKATINWVWMPPWGLEMITDDGREQLRALGFNI
jgi:metal-sulfur cluster biosynthetic enzyme